MSKPHSTKRIWWTGITLGLAAAILVACAASVIFGIRAVFTSTEPVTYAEYPEPQPTTTPNDAAAPKNIIVFVADGLGFAHLSLGLLTQGNKQSKPVWNRFPVIGWQDPRPYAGPITDSAASATALGTGKLTYNNRIGIDHEGTAQRNLFEVAWDAGYRTGIVTDSYVWDATPAAFVTHTSSRDNAEDILNQLAQSELEILFGELEDVGEEAVPTWDATLEILGLRFVLLDDHLRIPAETAPASPLAVVFPEDHITDLDSAPNLPELVEVALERLSSSDKPFLLLVESEELDSASHQRNSDRAIRGIAAIEATLTYLLRWAESDPETLLLVTSDHETGGLALSYDVATYPALKLVWSSSDHTAVVVPVLAHGPSATLFSQTRRIWEIGQTLQTLINKY